MTVLDLYERAQTLIGKGYDISTEPRWSNTQSIAFTDRHNISMRYFMFKGDCLQVAYQSDCLKSDGWSCLELWCPDGEIRVSDSKGLGYSEAMEYIGFGNLHRFSNRIEC